MADAFFAGLEPPMQGKDRDRPTWIRYSGVGIEFAAAVGGFALLGYWIDRHWDTSPTGLLICLALGLIGGTYNLIRESMKAFDAQSSRAAEKRDGDADEPPEQTS